MTADERSTREIGSRYRLGDRVRVKMSSVGPNPRTPAYVRGKTGVIVELHGPTNAPHDHRGTYPFLYTIAFDISKLTRTSSKHRVLLDLREEWLDPA
jgi:Nitrile hydratase beta subunit